MEWTQSDTIALAKRSCPYCDGLGLKKRGGIKKKGRKKLPPLKRGPKEPCNCVLRAIFKACFSQFQYCSMKEKFISKVSLVRSGGKDSRRHYERLDEDYVADFTLVSRRRLDESDWRIFHAHFILGAEWRLCCRVLKIERGSFWHAVYRIERQLGRVFRELEPYGLYPLDEYFGGTFSRKRLSVELPSGAAVGAVVRPASVVVSTKRLAPPIRKRAA